MLHELNTGLFPSAKGDTVETGSLRKEADIYARHIEDEYGAACFESRK
jgi:hypothetical protein